MNSLSKIIHQAQPDKICARFTPMDFNNIWLYTLSACSQVLAAVVGLFAVFVVYKIQSFSDIFEDVKGGVVNMISNYYKLHPTNQTESIDVEELIFLTDQNLLNKFENSLAQFNSEENQSHDKKINSSSYSPLYGFHYEFNEKTLSLFRGFVNLKNEILRNLKIVLITNVFSISSSIILLSLSDYLANKWLLLLNSSYVVLVLINTGLNTYTLSKK